MKTFRRIVLAALGLLFSASIGHRLWFQYRPLPAAACVQRPMTQAEWELRAGTNSPVPANFSMIDESPYPAAGHPVPISTKDIRKIRALASWGALLPFRTVWVQVWGPTNVSLL